MNDTDRQRIEDLAERIRMAGGWCSDGGYTDAASLAKFFDISPRTFRDWRAKDFPSGYDLGRKLWDLADVADWLEKRRESGGPDESRRRARADSGRFGRTMTCSSADAPAKMTSADQEST